MKMNRYDFIENLRRALSGQMPSGRVAEHIAYYEEYIDMQIKKGKTEEEVLSELGEPRLLAKSIVTAEGTSYDTKTGHYEETPGAEERQDRGFRAKAGRWNVPVWFAGILIVLFIILILVCIFAVTIVAFKILLPVLLILLLIRLIVKLFRRE